MIVIKLGGSLTHSKALINCLNKIELRYQGRAVIIVPGGGAFADQVRLAQQQWQFDEVTAHHMAILAMQQMALMFKGLAPQWPIVSSLSDMQQDLYLNKTFIWSPNSAELDQAAIPATWDITSDSLAAWLAKQVSSTELILVKSAVIDPQASLEQLAAQQIIDQGFCQQVQDGLFRIRVVNQRDF
ncbi:MAG: uridylate kinase [Methylococcales bacterium]|nr:MAG: uridylate kinase [Methylococcales bacterium]